MQIRGLVGDKHLKDQKHVDDKCLYVILNQFAPWKRKKKKEKREK